MSGFIDNIKSIFGKKEEGIENYEVPNSFDVKNTEKEPEVEIVQNSKNFENYRYDINFDSTSSTVTGLVNEYREIAQYPEVDEAISEIVNEAIVQDGSDVVTLEIESEDVNKKLKETIQEEFSGLVSMMKLNQIGDELFRQWYIDGRLYLHGVIDLNNPKNGIQDVKKLTPFGLKKIKEDGKLFFIADDEKSRNALKIPSEHITFIHSTLTDPKKKYYISSLHKAIKPYNQLKMLEDSAVIYRITRAPERRVFYIDVGQMNKSKAESYVAGLVQKFKNKITYDGKTGKVSQSANSMSMTEDFWLPSSASSSGSRGTKVDVLPAGCLAMDTKVSLLDGRELSITDIEKEITDENELWTYSCHPITGAVVPGLISWAGVTQKSAKVMKLTLDNGEEITCTPDHKFPIYIQGFKRADELIENESMIPLYRDDKIITNRNKLDYEQYFDNEEKKWYYSHRKIGKIEYLDEEIEVGTLTIDFEEKYHNYHTFALSAGIFTKNSQLGEMGDIQYFNKKLKKSLNVPFSRFSTEEKSVQVFGNMRGELERDEIRFARFINKQRYNFSAGLFDLLKKQLIFKGILDLEDWYKIKDELKLLWNTDSYFEEVKQGEILKSRVEIAESMNPFVGKYFSHDYVQRNVFQMTDEEIETEEKKMEEESKVDRFKPEDSGF